MNIIRGFAVIPALFNTNPGQTALFGELSDRSESFSLTKAEYVDGVNFPGVQATLFSSLTDAGAQVSPTNGVISHILAVITWVYGQYVTSSIPPQVDQSAFITSLAAQFPAANPPTTTSGASGWVINNIINGIPSTKRMPDNITWHYNDNGIDNQLQIWFSDTAFATQYPGMKIFLIPPTPVIDNLNAPAATVAALLQQFTIANAMAAVANLMNGVPPTDIVTQTLVYTDPTVVAPNVPGTINTTWTAVVYGAAGIDSDNIKAAIQNYITANTALTNWNVIYPGLYSSNEFTLVPLWDNVAVPATGLDTTLYSSAIGTGNLPRIASELVPAVYGQSTTLSVFLTAYMRLVGAAFSAIQLLAVANPNNEGGLFDFIQVYPDYTDLPTTSGSFGWMSASTQAFCTQLAAAIGYAETLTLSSIVPGGYTRVVRNGLVYLSFTMGSFTIGSTVIPAMSWLVLAKSSYAVT